MHVLVDIFLVPAFLRFDLVCTLIAERTHLLDIFRDGRYHWASQIFKHRKKIMLIIVLYTSVKVAEGEGGVVLCPGSDEHVPLTFCSWLSGCLLNCHDETLSTHVTHTHARESE